MRIQAVFNYTSDGTKYLAYGGDFGDKPNSGQFVMNGINARKKKSVKVDYGSIELQASVIL